MLSRSPLFLPIKKFPYRPANSPDLVVGQEGARGKPEAGSGQLLGDRKRPGVFQRIMGMHWRIDRAAADFSFREEGAQRSRIGNKNIDEPGGNLLEPSRKE